MDIDTMVCKTICYHIFPICFLPHIITCILKKMYINVKALFSPNLWIEIPHHDNYVYTGMHWSVNIICLLLSASLFFSHI